MWLPSNPAFAAYRAYALVGLVIVACGMSALAGWRVSMWRSDSLHSAAVATLNAEVQRLKLAIAQQDGRIAAMQAATDTAEAARKAAEDRAVALAKASAGRVARIDAIALTTCDDAIRDVWGIKQ